MNLERSMIKHRAQDKNERGLSVMEKLKLDFYYGREAEQFTFYRLPKALITDACFKGMTNNAKLLYGLMLDRMSLSKKRGWLDEANKVFIKYSLNNIEEDLNVSRKTASSLLKELEEIGLIDMIQQPGVANIIYVKNFVSERDQEVRNQREPESKCKRETGVKSKPVEKVHQCKNSTGEKTTPVEKSNQCSFEPGTSGKITLVPGGKLHPSNIETCIHHDNGVIGAETFPEAEWYRCKRLKEAGFNAIRSSHHPMSRAMLDACDHLGMLVMDELTDMWNRGKNTYDFSDIFKEEAPKWIHHMVDKDYNHPSVVIYSVGNEIQEAGTKQGSWINRSLCNRFHELDATRFTTNALNGLNCAGKRLKVIMKEVIEKFGMDTQGNGSGGGSNALNSFMSLMSGEKGEFFAKHPLVTEALEECAQSCDITGLNYLSGRYELEHVLHPGKTVLGTETYPADIENLWVKVTKYPHVIGDFTWTGYDYIGEAGVGIFHYDGKENFTSIYPERLGYIGDIDLIGNRRPISYFREIVYGLTNQPYIAVERMEHRGQTASKTAWMFKDNISSWTWKGHEGEKASVDVYSSGDEVELFLNGKSLGRKPAGKKSHYTATYEVAYESGTLKAIAYELGKEIGKYELVTADSVKRLKACRVTENERDVAYVKVWLEDEHGVCNPQETQRRIIHAKVTGNGVLEGFGTANPSSEEDYFSDTVTTFEGSALAVVRWKDSNSKESAVLRLWTDDDVEVCIDIGR